MSEAKNTRDLAQEVAEWVQGGSPLDETATEHLALRIDAYVAERAAEMDEPLKLGDYRKSRTALAPFRKGG